MLLQRLKSFLSKPIADPGITALYQSCVIQGRQPEFYQSLNVPDTIDGRFDVLVLHVVLVMGQLPAAAQQQLFDLMFADMDRNLREMGVGDMGIGKRMKRMIAAFYGRRQTYETALTQNDQALATALNRNIYGDAVLPAETLAHMVTYVRQAVTGLEKQSEADLLSGRATFPEPVDC